MRQPKPTSHFVARDNPSYHLRPRYDYKIAREYNWNVKNKASKGYEENYFFIFRDGDGVYYNELETRHVIDQRRRVVIVFFKC